MLILHISICGQDFGTLSLHSSLERSNRKILCPRESIALTCTVTGTTLKWEAQEGDSDTVHIYTFDQNSSTGSGFSNSKKFSCHDSIFFTGALNVSEVDPNRRVNSNQLLKSSMVVMPVSENALSHCPPLTIICEPLNGNIIMNQTIQYAGESLI